MNSLSSKNKIHSSFLIRLILLSFIFTFTSIQPLEWHKSTAEKFSQIETSADFAVLKSTSDSKLLKRIPFLESLIGVTANHFLIDQYSLSESFFDFKITFISYDLLSSLARAPPVIS